MLTVHAAAGLTHEEREHIRLHYQRALPWLERHFGGTPVMFVTFPGGWAGDAVFHNSPAEIPKTIGTVEVRTSSGVHPYVRLNAHNVTWLCAAHTAVEAAGQRTRPKRQLCFWVSAQLPEQQSSRSCGGGYESGTGAVDGIV